MDSTENSRPLTDASIAEQLRRILASVEFSDRAAAERRLSDLVRATADAGAVTRLLPHLGAALAGAANPDQRADQPGALPPGDP